MQQNPEQYRFLQRLGGASLLFIALTGLVDLFISRLATPSGGERTVAWLTENAFLWYPTLLSAVAITLGMAAVSAMAARLEPYQPVWASLVRTWGHPALVVNALFGLMGGMPFFLVRMVDPGAMEAWLPTQTFSDIRTAFLIVSYLLLALLGLTFGMAALKGGISRLSCYLAFLYGGMYALFFVVTWGFGIWTPVQGWLQTIIPFVQLAWLISSGVELIRYPNPAPDKAPAIHDQVV